GSWQLRRDGRCGLRRIERRIQQQRVLTQQATTWPKDLDEKIQVGLANRLGRRNPDNVFAVRAQNRGKSQVGQKVRTINTRPVEVLGRCQPRNHLPWSQGFRIEQFDFSDQGLIQRRLQRDLSHSQRINHFGCQSSSSRDCQHQIANPNHYVIPCFAFSDFREGLVNTARTVPNSNKPEQCRQLENFFEFSASIFYR